MAKPVRPRVSRFITALFLVVLVVTLLGLIRLMAVYLASIVLAGVLVSLFYPVFNRILRRVGDRRRVAAGITTALVVLVVLIPLGLVLASLSAEAVTIYRRATDGDQPFVERMLDVVKSDNPVVTRIRDLGERAGLDLSPESLRRQAASAGATAATFVYEQLSGFATNFFKVLIHFGLMLIMMFALFVDGPRLKAYLLDLSPLPDDEEEMMVARFASISRAVFQGNGVASLAQGILGGLGFYMFGVGSGVLWGTAIAFFAFLPIVGATIVFVPAAIYLFLTGHTGLAIGFTVYNMTYVALLEYGLKPRLIGEHSHTHPVLVFVSILAGLSLFGILGLFYGPLILTMFLTISEIYKHQYRDDLMNPRSPWVRADIGGERDDEDDQYDASVAPTIVVEEKPHPEADPAPEPEPEPVANRRSDVSPDVSSDPVDETKEAATSKEPAAAS